MAKKKNSANTVAGGISATKIVKLAPPSPKKNSAFSAASIRESIEAIATAFVLAFLFRGFAAEAFVIPTGSMAPTLMGAHKDLLCPQCGYRYQAGASSETEEQAQQLGRPGHVQEIVACSCPLCRFTASVDPRTEQGREHPSFGGDRILVEKVTIELNEPRRWDVTVFKFPGKAQANYIKRLVGLPRETVRIWHGDLYFKSDEQDEFHLDERQPGKLQAMAQIVYDNDYVIDELTKKGWPLRWQNAADSGESWKSDDGGRSFATDGSSNDARWLVYRHFVPSIDDWRMLKREALPEGYRPRPRLVTDYVAYDSSVPRGEEHFESPQLLGLHWVGDLMLDCELTLAKAEGTTVLELINGGRHFRCSFDCASGQATLSIDALDNYQPTAKTACRGPGRHRVMFSNFDRQLVLWVDGSPVTFDTPTTYPPLNNDEPKSDEEDPGDLAPARVGSQGAAVKVNHLRLLRDIYYIAVNPGEAMADYPLRSSYADLLDFWSNPAAWHAEGNLFDARREALFPLDDHQFFMLGDNSPLSQDARLWEGEQYVRRELLVGKAVYIFWPHSFDKIPGTNIPFPFFPNFARMGLIR
jgi:signal peptidase I